MKHIPNLTLALDLLAEVENRNLDEFVADLLKESRDAIKEFLKENGVEL